MGLTHYWERPAGLPADEFAKASEDIKVIFGLLGIPLGDSEGLREALFEHGQILFNGAHGTGCEPFIFRRYQEPRPDRETVLGYCKTEGLPYDMCVRCALIILKHHMGNLLSVMSDSPEDIWQQARAFCENGLGLRISFGLDA